MSNDVQIAPQATLTTCSPVEGTAVGFNRKKKGQRSYYPLFGTVAQTGQVLDVLHRSGNVHDSHGAQDFMLEAIATVRAALPRGSIEVRMDSAFFSDEIIASLDAQGVDYTVSVPFDRFAELKERVEVRRWWWQIAAGCAYPSTGSGQAKRRS
ncbi:MAG: transposase [Gammaproteobacteria bacterium]